jgi:osmoprotectant transport system permease protein
VRAVDADVLEAARGMGMGPLQASFRIELPLAMPVIVAGLRTAAVQVIATATLGAWVAEGGLGRYIFDGLDRQELDRMIVGGLLVAVLAVGADWAIGLVERRLESPGIRPAGADTLRTQVAGATSR